MLWKDIFSIRSCCYLEGKRGGNGINGTNEIKRNKDYASNLGYSKGILLKYRRGANARQTNIRQVKFLNQTKQREFSSKRTILICTLLEFYNLFCLTPIFSFVLFFIHVSWLLKYTFKTLSDTSIQENSCNLSMSLASIS